uniref:NADH dehydrogenase subunit 6 n=1 Tax=Morimospasma tuberculatum TaxID=2874575 RepID=UPI002238E306|nr:NADH dehydrogenase subunit 6 [Morimospasma tuberculatum]UYB77598.1 NADH dehydrogenase subunit 6 [Morimospasma tuberculatum]WEY30156.1 NADH dehydrogenase subunit 6 [Morimospasma sp.]
MMMIFFSTSIMMGMIFLFLNHPLSFGLILLFQTISIALMTGMMNFNYWFSYIIFLVMIGGMLILFIYMTSVASNEKFKFSYKIMTMIFMISLIFLLMIMMDLYYFNLTINNFLNTQNWLFKNQFILSLNKFLTWPMNFIFYMMIIYLLITLIMAVKITNIKSGPLRQKF